MELTPKWVLEDMAGSDGISDPLTAVECPLGRTRVLHLVSCAALNELWGFESEPRMQRPVVRPGQIEGSAVEPVPELIRMIQALRSYEAAASALRATDQTLQRAVNDIARI